MDKIITFEYPLNEKIRSYLRFEFLFLQIEKSKNFSHENDETVFFKSLFELLELSERCDIRHDLAKDLRLLAEPMSGWLKHEQVDHLAVSELLAEISLLSEALQSMPKQLRYFKTNRFLTSLKQRFSIPSGCCNFDLPQLHFWSMNSIEKKVGDAKYWLSHFEILQQALMLFLKIKRSQGTVSKQSALNGFYQGMVENSSFVTIEIAQTSAVYPVISGHKDRYSIRFMSADIENHLAENIEFEQICC